MDLLQNLKPLMHRVQHILSLLLPSNWGIPIPVWLSLFAVLTAYLGIHMAIHEAKKEWQKWFYKAACVVLSLLIIILTWVQNHDDTVEKRQLSLEHNRQLKEERVEGEKFYKDQLTNSDTSYRDELSILASLEGLYSRENKQLLDDKRAISEAPETLQQSRARRANEQALEEVRKKQLALNQEREESNAKEAERRSIIQRKINDARVRVETSDRQRQLTDQCVKVFDYVIYRLNTRLTDYGNETKNQVTNDFRDSPSVNNSSFLSGGNIVSGTNFMKLGSSSWWAFALIGSPLHTVAYSNDAHHVQTPRYFAPSLTVVCSGESPWIVIQPRRSKEPGHWSEFMGDLEWPSNFDSLSIQVRTNSVIKIDMTNSFSNYRTNVDEALRVLIDAQDVQFPLTTKP